MLAQVNTTSALFRSHFQQLEAKFPKMVECIRGRGLILGIQLKGMKNKSAVDVANSVLMHARQRGLLIITAGEGTVRLVPALNIPEDVVLRGLAILEVAMELVYKEHT